jgi:hypothetical protein
MNHPDTIDRIFPLSQGTPARARLCPPRLFASPTVTAPAVLGHGAFMRAWAARRHALAAAARPAAEPAGAGLR